MTDHARDGSSLNVFLSYSADGRPLAEEVRRGLNACGYSVWSDEAIRPGESLFARISSALKDADAFVVVLTQHVSESQWALLELGAAVASGKRIVPILAQADAEPPIILQDRQYLDLSDPETREDGIEVLCEVLAEPDDQARTEAETRDWMGLVDDASAVLERERAAYERATRLQTTVHVRTQIVAAILAVLAAAGALIATSVSTTAVVTGVVSGVTALVAAALGFYFGSERGRGRL